MAGFLLIEAGGRGGGDSGRGGQTGGNEGRRGQTSREPIWTSQESGRAARRLISHRRAYKGRGRESDLFEFLSTHSRTRKVRQVEGRRTRTLRLLPSRGWRRKCMGEPILLSLNLVQLRKFASACANHTGFSNTQICTWAFLCLLFRATEYK